MGRLITTAEAAIKTATVEIKTLTVGGRQMTLSVFRQLVKKDLLCEETGELLGVPWGLVNYFWEPCGRSGSHLHAVWQEGIQLRRACVWESRLPDYGRRDHEARQAARLDRIRDAVKVTLLRNAIAGLGAPKALLNREKEDGWDTAVSMPDGTKFPVSLALIESHGHDQRCVPHWLSCLRYAVRDFHDSQGRADCYAADGEVRRLLKRAGCVGGDSTPEGLLQVSQQEAAAWLSASASAAEADTLWARHYGEIAALDQLFIAV